MCESYIVEGSCIVRVCYLCRSPARGETMRNGTRLGEVVEGRFRSRFLSFWVPFWHPVVFVFIVLGSFWHTVASFLCLCGSSSSKVVQKIADTIKSPRHEIFVVLWWVADGRHRGGDSAHSMSSWFPLAAVGGHLTAGTCFKGAATRKHARQLAHVSCRW